MLKETEVKIVLNLVKQTRELILREMENAKVTVKGAADYVTNVDFAVQEFLKAELGKCFPDIRMIAEEKENKDLTPDGTYWILDPIDGTTNLINHYGLSAVALALYEQGEITLGVVYNPFNQELFHGVKGGGAYLNGEKIQVPTHMTLKDSVVSYGSCPYEKERAKEFFSLYYEIFMRCGDFRRTGSAELDLCYIACGRHHAYLELNLKPWDYSAGSVIVTEAGGVIKGWGKEKLPYLKNADVIACAPQLEKELTELVKVNTGRE